jgi:hypothetical protein
VLKTLLVKATEDRSYAALTGPLNRTRRISRYALAKTGSSRTTQATP